MYMYNVIHGVYNIYMYMYVYTALQSCWVYIHVHVFCNYPWILVFWQQQQQYVQQDVQAGNTITIYNCCL